MKFFGITLGAKTNTMKRDRNDLLSGFAKYISPYSSTKTKFSEDEKEVIKRISSFILDKITDGELTGQCTFKEKLSPLGQDLIAFLANNDIYWENGCFRVDWNWSDLVNKYRRNK